MQFGRNFYSRYDYEGVESEAANKMIAHLEGVIAGSKKGVGGGAAQCAGALAGRQERTRAGLHVRTQASCRCSVCNAAMLCRQPITSGRRLLLPLALLERMRRQPTLHRIPLAGDKFGDYVLETADNFTYTDPIDGSVSAGSSCGGRKPLFPQRAKKAPPRYAAFCGCVCPPNSYPPASQTHFTRLPNPAIVTQVAKNQGIRFVFQDGSRIIFRLRCAALRCASVPAPCSLQPAHLLCTDVVVGVGGGGGGGVCVCVGGGGAVQERLGWRHVLPVHAGRRL